MVSSYQVSKKQLESETFRNQKNLKAAAKVKNHECCAQPLGEQAQVRAATLHQGETGRKRTDPGSPKITPGDAKQTSEGA